MSMALVKDPKYGIPKLKKFPLPDARHVRSAIRFFNYAPPRYERQLAAAILKRMKEYGLTFDDFTVGDENRFSKYMPKRELMHHGIKGMHWGIRRYQNPDGTLTAAGKKKYSDVHNLKTSKNNEFSLLERRARKGSTDIDYKIVAEGKKIGNLFLENHGKDLYINWIDIKTKNRGKGYAQAVLDYIIRYGKDSGYKTASLEVPDSSPDAEHIYKKKGFKDDGTYDEYGLKKMRLSLR